MFVGLLFTTTNTMMIMSTRVTCAASKRAKETLIQLLFPQQQAKRGKDARYTHLQLRMAYLQKVHIMHPDKQRSSSLESIPNKSTHEKFVQLKNAWEAYDVSARMFQKQARRNLDNDDDNNDDFTMFGVGCSFSDSSEEKELRNEIMEQACKGWLPYAALSHSDTEVKSPQQSCTKLSDDNMFMQEQSPEASNSTNVTKKSLVQNVEHRNRTRKKSIVV